MASTATPRVIRVKHSVTFDGRALACLDGLPGPDPDLLPDSLRSLAAALLRIAADCEAVHERGVRLPAQREYTW